MMDHLFTAVSWIVPAGTVLFFLAAGITAVLEREYRAASLLSAAGMLVLAVIILLQFAEYGQAIQLWLSGLLLLVSMFFLIPVRGRPVLHLSASPERFNEAESVLSRRLLEPGTERFDRYYSEHPDHLAADDASREAPGLLSDRSRYFEAASFGAAEAGFKLTDHLHALCDGRPGPEKQHVEMEGVSRMIGEWLLHSGAHSVGFTLLRDAHVYSRKGRGKDFGKPIDKRHKYAIAFTVEMDYGMMRSAPMGSTVMESSEQYLNSGVLATRLAVFIRQLGYEARAHIDGNYEVICPLVAMDAGLGVIGRMGLLMTPDLGPRVRIAVVTTNLPVSTGSRGHDRTMLDFCMRCRKCATVCPVRAIPFGEMEEEGGTRRWRIDSEKCYHFWTVSGTDCGKCMVSCPYAHPDNWFHRFIRFGIKNNLFFRVAAVKLDDVFYGKRPKTRPLPGWVSLNSSE